MKLLLSFVLLTLAIANASGHDEGQLHTDAAARPDCACQCDSYEFVDEQGKTQGNCNSADKGKLWCFVKGNSVRACADTQIRHGRESSAEACATPAPGSLKCRIYN